LKLCQLSQLKLRLSQWRWRQLKLLPRTMRT